MEDSYLRWLAKETPTTWWHDSGDPAELRLALEHGAEGVTTNPPLIGKLLDPYRDRWSDVLNTGDKDLTLNDRAELILRTAVQDAAKTLLTNTSVQGSDDCSCKEICKLGTQYFGQVPGDFSGA
jgi:Transaldolase